MSFIEKFKGLLDSEDLSKIWKHFLDITETFDSLVQKSL